MSHQKGVKHNSMTRLQRVALCERKEKNPSESLKDMKAWLEREHSVIVSVSALSTTLRKSSEYLQAPVITRPDSKRQRSAMYPDVEEALFNWFNLYQDKVDMSGDLLRQQASKIFKTMHPNAPPFLFSDGWLTGFKNRVGIKSYRRFGESGSVDMVMLEAVLPEIREKLALYEWRDIYNMDETGLFYRMHADRSLATKQLEGTKKDKERISVALCCNGDGSDKLPPLIIGKYENPRCFKNICRSNMRCQYRWNKKARMQETIFMEWLQWFDKRVNRKVLLLVDNCSAHGKKAKLPELVNTEVCYLPPNTTSKIQPLDAGIIRSFKAHYRLRYTRQVLRNIGQQVEKPSKLDILSGITYAVEAWDEVTPTTITNCFKHCKIRTDETSELQTRTIDEDQDVIEELRENIGKLPYQDPMSTDFLLNYPDEQESSYTPTLEDIIEDVQNPPEEEEEEEDDIIFTSKLNLTEIQDSLIQMERFFLMQSYDTQEELSTTRKLKKLTDAIRKKGLVQSTLDDFISR